jgi:anti-sigma B factor antagonist
MRIQQTPIEPDIVLVHITGRLSVGRDCEDLQWAVDELIRGNRKKVVFDLSELNYVDSMGVGILVMCSGRLTRAGGELRMASLQPRIAELMRITKLDQILYLFPTTALAIEDFA